jgi:hypothetical protein
MVATITVRNMLQQMSLSLEAATDFTAVNGQNLYIEDNFLKLNNKDIKTLCCVIRWWGGANAAGNIKPEAHNLQSTSCYSLLSAYCLGRHHPRQRPKAFDTGRDGVVHAYMDQKVMPLTSS